MIGLYILVAVLGIAFVIFIHELGHFLFAKWAGVKVERFSIGMGPIIWSRTLGETEYALSILPVGGYVKMFGHEEMPGQAVESQDKRSYANKHPAWKAAILFAGVLFNLVSSYLILLCLAWYGMPVITPQVGDVQHYVTDQNGEQQVAPAWANNLKIGDRILTVNDKKVRSYTDIAMYSIAAGTEPVEMQVRRQDGSEYAVTMQGVYDRARGSQTLGIDQPAGLRTQAVINLSGVTSALQVDDRIVGIVGEADDFEAMHLVGGQLFNRLSSYVGQEIKLQVKRDGKRIEVPFTYAGQTLYDLCGPSLGALVMVADVFPNTPAALAQVLPGDYLSAVNGRRIKNSADLIGQVRNATLEKKPIQLSIYRYEEKSQHYQALSLTMQTEIDPHTGRSVIGIAMAQALIAPYLLPLNDAQAAAMQAAQIDIGDVVMDVDISYDTTQGEDNKQAKGLRVLVAKMSSKSAITLTEKTVDSSADESGDKVGKESVDKTTDNAAAILKLPLTPEAVAQLQHVSALGFWSKLLGAKPKRSLWSRLAGAQVAQAADESSEKNSLMLKLIDRHDAQQSEEYEVDLTKFPQEQRTAFYALHSGDYIAAQSTVMPDGSPALLVLRGVQPEQLAWHTITLENYGSLLATMSEVLPYQLSSWTEGFSVANDMCTQMVVTTLRIIPRFFKAPEAGGVDASKSLSGPIGIFGGMKDQLEYNGFPSFFKFIAFIGINLFLVNLLPIPIVDGGQLVFLGIEVIIRRPVPAIVHEIAGYIGLLLIVSLMIFVIGNDISRRYF